VFHSRLERFYRAREHLLSRQIIKREAAGVPRLLLARGNDALASRLASLSLSENTNLLFTKIAHRVPPACSHSPAASAPLKVHFANTPTSPGARLQESGEI